MNTPYGGTLQELLLPEKQADKLKVEANDYPSWTLSKRQVCDVELLLNGGFSPLTGFMNKADYEGVCKDMRLTDGTLWPMPITLDVDEDFAKTVKKGSKVALRTEEGVLLAVLTVGDSWKPDKKAEASQVYATAEALHPAVDYLFNKANDYYLGGTLEGVQLPTHYDFLEDRRTPAELRDSFEKQGWIKIVAFQTRNPMHRAHVELTFRASKEHEANLLINPTVGMTKPGDVDYYTRVRIYRKLRNRYPESTAMISLLPLAMRMGGPREAVWHSIVRKNYGATHFIVGRDHAGPGKNSQGEDFYGPYEAQELVRKHQSEIGIIIVPFQMMVYVKELDKYEPIDEVPKGMTHASISGTELRARLADGRELPEWFTYPEVAEELRKTYPPRHRQGFTVLFTGLSGSGKSTLANALRVRLNEIGGRPVTLLDGDIVRTHLSSELGFSPKDRDTNIRRIGFVASEIAKNGGIALCAPIAPYGSIRKEVRSMVRQSGGGFMLAYINTPLEECEKRDRKGLYAKARAGKIKNFTGIDDPYEAPDDADLVLDTTKYSPEELTQQLLLHIEREGYVSGINNGQ